MPFCREKHCRAKEITTFVLTAQGCVFFVADKDFVQYANNWRLFLCDSIYCICNSNVINLNTDKWGLTPFPDACFRTIIM